MLRLTGAISTFGSTAAIAVTSGTVVLAHAANSYFSTALSGADLEIAVTGAAGAGALTFTNTGTGTAPVLQIDAGVAFGNTIAGFAGADTIDLRGFGFGAGVADSYAGGTLSLSDGSATASLVFSGTYTAASFAFADDHHGGTVISVSHK